MQEDEAGQKMSGSRRIYDSKKSSSGTSSCGAYDLSGAHSDFDVRVIPSLDANNRDHSAGQQCNVNKRGEVPAGYQEVQPSYF